MDADGACIGQPGDQSPHLGERAHVNDTRRASMRPRPRRHAAPPKGQAILASNRDSSRKRPAFRQRRIAVHPAARAQGAGRLVVLKAMLGGPTLGQRERDTSLTCKLPTPPVRTLVMNFLQTPRMSWFSVAENIMTCFSCGVSLKISWQSARISAKQETQGGTR